MSAAMTADMLRDAVALHRQGALDAAAARYGEVLQAEPGNGDALYYLAMIACQHGRFAEGADLARKSIAAEASQARTHVLLGRALSALARPADALASFDRAIALAPDLVQAHGNRGNVLSDLGRNAEAVESYDRALACQPDSVEDWFNRGLALQALERFGDAVASFDRATALKHDFAKAHLLRAIALARLGKHDDALGGVDRALAIEPHAADAHVLRGTVLGKLDRPQEALVSFDHALTLAPARGDALASRSAALNALKRHDEAIAAAAQALASNPKHFDALLNAGVALFGLRRFGEALAMFERALALRPDDVTALYNHGYSLSELGRHQAALVSYERLLGIDPQHVDAMLHRGIAQQKLNLPFAALASYDRVLTLAPARVDALLNRGTIFQDLDRPAEALACYQKVLAIAPDHPEAHFGASMVLLRRGDFQRGWPEYEWRSKREKLDPAPPELPTPLWLGEWPLQGRTILLHAEQGLGDTIQMARYVPLVARQGASVVLAVQAPLKELLSQVPGVATLVSEGERLPPFDCHCPLFSLPLAFRTDAASIPAATPFLSAPASRVAHWQSRLPSGRNARIGVVWGGNARFPRDYGRSLTLAEFSPVLTVPRASFVSLNPGINDQDAAALSAMPNVLHLGAELRDFSDTAAVVDCLDLVITSDTAVAHLAGAMGKAVWVVLAYGCDWRWIGEGDTCPWYPTARLFRQSAPCDWPGVIARVREELTAVVGG